MTSYQEMDVRDIASALYKRPDTLVNLTLFRILQNRQFTFDERVLFLGFLFNQYEQLVRAVRNYRPDCSEHSCTGEIFLILDTWVDAWEYVIVNGLVTYMGYSQDLYNISLLCR